ncbi:MAG: hypothetical protein NC094_12775 [Bacteroidales bacterium]|nr:hypothetical protein [Lachnoclostridium sp.]MCM1466279.1 hypothetical protein [Bacteroidales bacterium]
MKNGFKHLVKGMAAVLATSFALAGCSSVIPNMSVEEEQAVGEYAAFVLLKYDAHHRSRLVDLSKVVEKEPPKAQEPVESQEQGGMGPVADTPVIDNTMNNVNSIEAFFGLPEGISFTYQGIETGISYQEPGQEDGHFSLEAAEGKSLFILKYQVSNQSQSVQQVDLNAMSPVFKITLNGSYTRTALVTMLPNDMSVYKEDLQPGESKELVLLLEINPDMAETITSVSLQIKNEANAYTIQLI